VKENMEEIRWLYRLENFRKAYNTLKSDVELANRKDLSNIEKRGLIQAFEYTYELAWNVIKDFYYYKGVVDIQGSRDAFKMAYNKGLISSDTLIKTIRSRQLTVHTYNEEIVQNIYENIINEYFFAFKELLERLEIEAKKCMG